VGQATVKLKQATAGVHMDWSMQHNLANLLRQLTVGTLTLALPACSDFSQFSDILYSLLGWGELFQTTWCGSGGGARYTILAPTNKVRSVRLPLLSMRHHSAALHGGPWWCWRGLEPLALACAYAGRERGRRR